MVHGVSGDHGATVVPPVDQENSRDQESVAIPYLLMEDCHVQERFSRCVAALQETVQVLQSVQSAVIHNI